ncbi:hypothetical protein RRG08_007147 [Elysia crispata]|uniref:Uncharacterized protein n=1 Tax=Elysia crispata TaxID=231223 RepID=A0AAE1CF24_9GAST|nr:hypothetical protein RRG08_007147 [Elysia crispata]
MKSNFYTGIVGAPGEKDFLENYATSGKDCEAISARSSCGSGSLVTPAAGRGVWNETEVRTVDRGALWIPLS